ncbi:hypothetical protein [Sphingomonas hengshuiensis]|uniref:Nucleotidyltransferase family protein n=1 Tax=Sphingomonas hengshuiensis TaxID=1609977 RepID=A0A7U4J6K0_9SPHN|nr:hypothetical protein [Sphingomonas hengshuiensis]AJP71032.1 hypothetical protein TS85_03150 [Sphingomonas hengshuiensis]
MTESDTPSGYRPEFEAALRLFARVSEAMHLRGLPRPVLVGGAAAEFWSASAVSTGDFDLCTPVQPELEDEMQRLGFVRPSGRGRFLKGWIHPELQLGFEIVADVPMDGNVDAAHIRLVQPIGETALFRVIAVEDLIADRMGQYASGTAPDRIGQAQILLALHPDADLAYLERRIREESGGDFGVQDIHPGP